MISRPVVAAALAFATLCAPAYAADQPETQAPAAANPNSTPQVARGRFPHRKPGAKAHNGAMIMAGTGLGAGIIAAIAQIGGSGGAVPPVSGQ